MGNKYKTETLAVVGGTQKDATLATNPAIYMSTAYEYKDAQHAADLFDLKTSGFIYTRLHNPTTSVLEQRIAALEGGAACIATSSGHFAQFFTICAIAKAGDEIVSSSSIYGGTFNMFSKSLKKLGITVKFADINKPEEFEALINDKTKAVFVEVVSNPACDIPPYEELSQICKKHKVPFIVDNTYLTPHLFKPKDFGADIIWHSTTKFLNGHSNAMGGAVVDCGTFDWSSGRFPDFTTESPSYKGVIYTKNFKGCELYAKLLTETMRDLGGCPSPFNSYLTLQGIQTLHVRMDRHLENTKKLVEFLKNHPKIEWVNYPSDPDNKNYALAQKYYPKGAGAVFTFGVKGGFEAGKKLIESVKLCVHTANLGDVRTLVTHPASTTHRQLTPEQRVQYGVPDSLVRISVGIENADDLIQDLEQALK